MNLLFHSLNQSEIFHSILFLHIVYCTFFISEIEDSCFSSCINGKDSREFLCVTGSEKYEQNIKYVVANGARLNTMRLAGQLLRRHECCPPKHIVSNQAAYAAV